MKSRKVIRPKQASHLRENALSDLYQSPGFLPPIWRVIYQEAMRGHDILFAANQDEETLSDVQDENQLGEISCRLMASSDLSEMRGLIASLKPTQRVALKRILRYTYNRWQHAHLRSLN